MINPEDGELDCFGEDFDVERHGLLRGGSTRPEQSAEEAAGPASFQWKGADGVVVALALICWGGMLSNPDLQPLGFMPLIGICTATIGNAFPVAGGVIFVPVLMMLNIHIHNAVAFSVATQTFGNGLFGTGTWLMRDPAMFIGAAIPPVLCGSALGVLTSLLVLPMPGGGLIEGMFGLFCLSVAAMVLRQVLTVSSAAVEAQMPDLADTNSKAVLVISGFCGGVCVG